MAEFVNTIDLLGDDAVIDSIINRTITEFKDDRIETIGVKAFCKCANLSTVDTPSVTTVGDSAFAYCASLVNVSLDSATVIGGSAFRSCNNLESVILKSAESLGDDSFTFCSKLSCVDLHKACTIGAKSFWQCFKLAALVIRDTEKLASIANTAVFSGCPIPNGTGYIYVPRALVDSYKAATNWSTFADQFRALEDYTVDGTTMGALDETKI